jgi:hypothetical protein
MVAIFADANRARIRVIKEDDAAWGVTPASGSSREIRYTSSTINAVKDTTMSNEVRADRMVSAIIETGARSAGELNVEFSAGSHDDFMEAFMYGAWTRPMTFDQVTGASLEWADTNTLYIKGKDVSDYFVSGRRVKTHGFVIPANNNYWQISTVSWNSGANRTEIDMTTSTAVAEEGSAYTAFYDANDVVVLKSTAIRAGTSGASTFDSNGGNAFAAAISAGQLNVGQKIFVDGLGLETGTVTFTDIPVAGSKVRVHDGDKSVTLQFGGTFGNGVVGVALASDLASMAENLYTAVNEQRVVGAIKVSATHSGAVVTLKNLLADGGTITEVLDSGSDITVSDFANGDTTVRGVFTLTAVTNDVLTVTPAPNTNANGGSRPVTIKASMLRNASTADDIVPQSFSIETSLEDVSQHYLTDGQRIGTMNLNAASNQILTGSYGLQGRGMTRSDTSVLGEAPYTVLETTVTQVANATVNVGAIKVNGSELASAIQSIGLSGSNNLRDQNAVGFKFPAGIGAGRMEITGTVVAYFADGTLWDKFIEHDTVSLEFSVEDVQGHHYEFTIPAANFSTDTVNPPGINQDIIENMEFMAKRDPITSSQFQIDRFSSVFAVTA